MADTSRNLAEAFANLTDTRSRRGIRHPFGGLLSLTFLGLLCRQCDFASISRWAKKHFDQLKGPLGFTKSYAPHATTIARACQKFSPDEFNSAVADWVASLAGLPVVAAVDGKTDKQAHDPDGDPIHVLNVFAHDLRVALACRPVGDGKETEAEVLKGRPAELFEAHPGLRVLTMDAGFTQRNLAALIVGEGRDYVMAIEDNQPDLHETAREAFADAVPMDADAGTIEKVKGGQRRGGSMWTSRRPSTPGGRGTSRG